MSRDDNVVALFPGKTEVVPTLDTNLPPKKRPYLTLPPNAQIMFITHESANKSAAAYSRMIISCNPEASPASKAKWPSELRALQAVLILEGVSHEMHTVDEQPSFYGCKKIPEALCINLIPSGAVAVKLPS